MTDRLEQPVAHRTGAFLRDHERLGHELVDQVEHVDEVDALACADRLGRFERETADERAEPPERRLFGWRQQVVAPVDGCLERSLARHPAARPATEEPKTLIESGCELFDAQASQARGRELEGERDGVESAAHLADRRSVGVGQREARVHRASAGAEQLDRVTLLE